jgi:transcriptional regulator with XRE-family HTH domain
VNTDTAKKDLLENCKDPEYREAFNLENVYATICAQIRALREQRNMSQSKLGREAKMAQERISILEDPNAETKPSLNTLLRLASAFDVGLDVRFVPFSTVLDNSINTDPKLLEVPSFNEELAPVPEKATKGRSLGDLLRESTGEHHSEYLKAISAMTSPLKGIDVLSRQVGEWGNPMAKIAEQMAEQARDAFKGFENVMASSAISGYLAVIEAQQRAIADIVRPHTVTSMELSDLLDLSGMASVVASAQAQFKLPHLSLDKSLDRHGGLAIVPKKPINASNQVTPRVGTYNPMLQKIA